MQWLDAHAGGVQAVATLVLVILTGYYAWTSRALVRESRVTLKATARMTLQGRLDRISEIMINDPSLYVRLDELAATGEEQDARFHIANMFVSVLEEAHTQFVHEQSMTPADWDAWVATCDFFLQRRYIAAYWQRVRTTYNASFQRFVEERLNSAP
ncbi:MAG: hypothetical protein M3069_14175 [Chloroflexota bacterium]|nr:hypothetical protein [Chloroflexota bacterium]